MYKDTFSCYTLSYYSNFKCSINDKINSLTIIGQAHSNTLL